MRAAVIRLPNPFDPSHRETAMFRRPRRIRTLVPRNRPVLVMLNGRPLLRAGWRRRLRDGDHVAVILLPRGGGGGGGGSNPLRLILSLALMAFAPWAAAQIFGTTVSGLASTGVLFGSLTVGQATALGIYMAGSMLVNALLPPSVPGRGPEASPTYSLQAQGNAARLDAPIPVQYGRLKFYPDFAAAPYADFASNEQYLYQLLCLGAGEFEVEGLYIEDTPISAFSEIDYELVPPGQQVTLFPTAVVTSVEVSGQELVALATGTWARVGTTVTITETDHLRAVGQAIHIDAGDPAVNGVHTIATVVNDNSYTVTLAASGSGSGSVDIRSVLGGAGGFAASAAGTVAHRLAVDLMMPRGLYVRTDKGEIRNVSLTVRVEAQRVDDLGEPIGSWILLGQHEIRDRTTTPQRLTKIYPLATPGRYRVRLWRVDALDTIHSDKGHEILVAGLRAYLAEPRDFGPVTLLALRMRASNNLSLQASRKVAVIATRKIPVWDGNAWTAPQASRSIAWALADAARNADYGARLGDDRLDLPALMALDALWTARGDHFDGRFDSATTWWEAARQIAMAGRAQPYMQGGRLRVVRDGPATVPVMLFTERNIVAGSFGIDYTLPGEATADAVDVGIFDEAIWAPRRIRAALTGSTAEKPARLDLFGVTGAAQGKREGLYHAACNRYRREVVRFETEMEGFLPSIGDLIAISHSMPGWGAQAEAVHWDPATLTLIVTEPLDWSGNHHVVGLRGRDGSAIGPIAVTRGEADDEMVLAEAPPEPRYTGQDAERTQVAFGDVEAWRALAKVAAITPRGLYRVMIEAVVEDPSVHAAETGADAPPIDYSSLPRVPVLPEVTGLMARLMADDSGRAVLAWRPAPGADIYHVEMAEGMDLSDAEVSWTRVVETAASQHMVAVLNPAETMVRVRALGLGPGPWVSAALGELVGLYWLAPDVAFWGPDPDPHWRS